MFIVIASPKPASDATAMLYVQQLTRGGVVYHTTHRSQARQYKTAAGAQRAADAGNKRTTGSSYTYAVFGVEVQS